METIRPDTLQLSRACLWYVFGLLHNLAMLDDRIDILYNDDVPWRYLAQRCPRSSAQICQYAIITVAVFRRT